MFKIDSYFFNVSEYQIELNEVGETRRSPFTGAIHTDSINEYYTFNLTIEDVDNTLHSHLLHLKDKCRSNNTLFFTDDTGNQYEVIIPIGGYSFERVRGEEINYKWELTLEEVIS